MCCGSDFLNPQLFLLGNWGEILHFLKISRAETSQDPMSIQLIDESLKNCDFRPIFFGSKVQVWCAGEAEGLNSPLCRIWQ